MTLKLHNTLSGRLEEVTPSDGKAVRMYVCGPNLYAPCHVGHAMSYINFDVLRRYMEYRGLEVKHVQNFTDIEDNILRRAQETGVTIDELAEEHIRRFYDDMASLNVQRAHEYPRATHEIPKIIEIVSGLIEKGYAYEVEGDVYYRVRKKPDYGKLSGQDMEAMQAGARVEPGENKEDPADFALWKAAKPGEPSWDSPWGPGRPGWHIECSAMSLRYLGEQIDIHGGGQDLIFPHHENEIAQSEAFTGVEPFTRVWVHHGLLRLPGSTEKMTRHLGNLVPIDEVIAQYGVDALRLFVLTSHYRKPLAYTDDALAAAARGAERLRVAARATADHSAGGDAVDPAPYRERFIEAMDDDLNAAKALAAMFDLAHEINRARDPSAGSGQARRPIAEAQAMLLELADVLGLTLTEPEADMSAAPFIELLSAVRNDLRAAKQFELADRVRSGLEELGIALEDTPEGTVWRRRE
jgi:cysteinyl-tRNA synthetase